MTKEQDTAIRLCIEAAWEKRGAGCDCEIADCQRRRGQCGEKGHAFALYELAAEAAKLLPTARMSMDKLGYTPLHYTTEATAAVIAKLLIDNGATE